MHSYFYTDKMKLNYMNNGTVAVQQLITLIFNTFFWAYSSENVVNNIDMA